MARTRGLRGSCSVCGANVALRKDGLTCKHTERRSSSRGACLGSGLPPRQVEVTAVAQLPPFYPIVVTVRREAVTRVIRPEELERHLAGGWEVVE